MRQGIPHMRIDPKKSTNSGSTEDLKGKRRQIAWNELF
jgi:hypothetical protein